MCLFSLPNDVRWSYGDSYHTPVTNTGSVRKVYEISPDDSFVNTGTYTHAFRKVINVFYHARFQECVSVNVFWMPAQLTEGVGVVGVYRTAG